MSEINYRYMSVPEPELGPSLADELSGSVDFDVMAFGLSLIHI